MDTTLIKNSFLKFFKKNGYKNLPASPLVLENDKSLLFTNSGMVQFKNIFLGLENYNTDKATTIQHCVRLGGKHNDLDNIGKTPHHNTSFEMLGNFGFNNISKEETINLAIEFLLNDLNLNKKYIYITINKDDSEALNFWLKHVNKERIILGSNETNFWQMAETGPCGYCSEIFYNIEEDKNKKNLLEIWNLVFINFNKQHDKLTKLKKTYIDTGMGLERIASIKQNVFDNFKTDIYKPLIQNTIDILKITESETNINIRIIVDHIKTCILLINENVMPANDGRGYILKKLIRRSIIKKQDLKTKIKLYHLVDNFIQNMHTPLHTESTLNTIKKIIKNEELKFDYTIKSGKLFVKKLIQKEKFLSGKNLFTLYDTYGMPIDVIENIAKEHNLKIEINDFKKELETQIKLNKIKSKKSISELTHITNLTETIFLGYEANEIDTIILKIIKNNIEVNEINKNDSAIIITKDTTFYAEKGGQTGDSGTIHFSENIFEVTNTKEFNNIFFHYGIMKNGIIKKNDTVKTTIALHKRNLIANNHSATHLLHASLKKILGKHVKQAGSLINENYLRFDFIHFNQLSLNEKKDIEMLVNKNIKLNLNVKVHYQTDTTQQLKNNKFKNRLIIIGEDISTEFCAGTHVNQTSEIGLFKIIKEYGIGNNIRRIEAITNYKIIDLLEEDETILDRLTKILKIEKSSIISKIENLLNKSKEIEKYNQTLILNNLKNDINKISPIKTKNNIKIISINIELNKLTYIQKIINNFKNTLLINFYENKNNLLIRILTTKDMENVSALDIIYDLTKKMDCTGGGNKDIANGIIYNKTNTNEIIKNIQLYLEDKNKI